MEPRVVNNWLVILRFKPEEVVVIPQPGIELHATITVPVTRYHRMTRMPNHTLAAFPHCLADTEDLELRVGGVVAVEEPVAIALGATRCPNCSW